MTQISDNKPKRKPGRPRKGEEVQNQIIRLAENGLKSPSVIAEAVGCDPSTVTIALKKYGLDGRDIKAYDENKVELLKGIQGKIIKAIAVKDLEDVPLQQLATSYGILVDKERLISGQSTSNMAVLVKIADDLDAKLDRL